MILGVVSLNLLILKKKKLFMKDMSVTLLEDILNFTDHIFVVSSLGNIIT
jgi:hypothetical protein